MQFARYALVFALICAALFAAPLQIHAEEEAIAKSPDKTVKAEGGEDENSKAKKTAPDVTGGRFAGDPIYVHIDPIMLPVITDQGVEQLVTILLAVEVKDFDAADDIHTQMPRVRDSLMRALYGGLGQGSLRVGKIVDVAKIKTKAVGALAEIVGGANIRDVLVQGIAQRML